MRNLLILFLMAGSCYGQTVTTNYIQAADFIREVDGKAYNINLSKVWEDINYNPQQTLTNGILAMKMKPHYRTRVSPGASYGNFIGGGSTSYQDGYTEEYQIFIRNCKPTAEGKTKEIRALKVGTTTIDGHTIEMWDIGTPHVVAIVRTNRVPTVAKDK